MIRINPVIALSVVLPLWMAVPFVLSDYYISLFNVIGIYAIVTLGLYFLTGGTGLTSFGQAAFMGVGAYATAWLTVRLSLSPWLGLCFAVLVASLLAAAIGSITLHLRGHYLPLSTLAWALALYYLFGAVESIGRHNGMSNIPPVALGSFQFDLSWKSHYLIWGSVCLIFFAAYNFSSTRDGRAIRFQRAGRLLVGSAGINSFRMRLAAFIIAAALAAIGGWLYAHTQRFVSPAPFNLLAGVEILLFAVVGGVSSLVGALIGPAVILLAKTAMQPLLMHVTAYAANVEVICFGLLFIIVLQMRPGGIASWLGKCVQLKQSATTPGQDPLVFIQNQGATSEMVRVEGVSKRFGGLVAVDDVGFSVRPGEIVAVIGPNGAGKSTLFNLVSGALRLDGGRIHFDDNDISELAAPDRAALGVSRTFQHVRIRRDLSILENVLLGAHLRLSSRILAGTLGLPDRQMHQAREDAVSLLRSVGISEDVATPAGDLPLGKQRVLEIARGLMSRPRLIMLDEPAAGLRKLEKRTVARIVKQLAADNVTVLLVDHDMDFVMGLADRIVVMNFGRVLTIGKPAEVREDAAVRTAYLGAAR